MRSEGLRFRLSRLFSAVRVLSRLLSATKWTERTYDLPEITPSLEVELVVGLGEHLSVYVGEVEGRLLIA